MNGTEQRARCTAVAEIARRQAALELAMDQRQADLELVVEALAKDIVVERQLRVDAVKGTRAACDERRQLQLRIDHADERALKRFLTMTLWERVRWTLFGRTPSPRWTAVGDGVADDYPAIQAAFDDAAHGSL